MVRDGYYARIDRVRSVMREKDIRGMFLSPSANLEYLTGEPRRKSTIPNKLWPNGWLTGVWITLDHDPFFTVPRPIADYELENREDWEVRILPDDADGGAFLKSLLLELRLIGTHLAVEDRAWSQFLIQLIMADPSIVPTVASEVMWSVRAVKDSEELKLITTACAITDAAYSETVKRMRLGMTERELVNELDYQIRALGSEPSGTIGVFGWGPSYPRQGWDREHPMSVPITPGNVVHFDFGALCGGYCNDVSRMIHMGEPTKRYLSVYSAVVETQRAAISAAKASQITAEQLHLAAVENIEKAGFGSPSPERLGHGIGMDVHEHPFLFTGEQALLEEGMVFAIEPMILKGRIYAQIEDIVVVRKDGAESLSHFSKELPVID